MNLKLHFRKWGESCWEKPFSRSTCCKDCERWTQFITRIARNTWPHIALTHGARQHVCQSYSDFSSETGFGCHTSHICTVFQYPLKLCLHWCSDSIVGWYHTDQCLGPFLARVCPVPSKEQSCWNAASPESFPTREMACDLVWGWKLIFGSEGCDHKQPDSRPSNSQSASKVQPQLMVCLNSDSLGSHQGFHWSIWKQH